MLFSLYQQNDRRKLLMRKMAADCMWGLHYIFLFAWAGAIPNIVGILRETIFVNNSKKWANVLFWPVFFILISWTMSILTWKSAISLLPMCASTLVTISLWINSPKMTRIISVPVCIAFFIYDIFVGSYAGMLNESVSLVSIFISIVKHDLKQKSK